MTLLWWFLNTSFIARQMRLYSLWMWILSCDERTYSLCTYIELNGPTKLSVRVKIDYYFEKEQSAFKPPWKREIAVKHATLKLSSIKKWTKENILGEQVWMLQTKGEMLSFSEMIRNFNRRKKTRHFSSRT